MKETILFTELKDWLEPIINQIRNSQIKASLSVNKEMISLYWYLGKEIVQKQTLAKWGNGFLTSMSKELQNEFPQMSGFSTDNLRFMKKSYLFYNQEDTIIAQVVQQFEENKLFELKKIENE